MRKASTLQCAVLRFCVPLLLLATFSSATSVIPTNQVSGNDVNINGKLVNEEVAKRNQQGVEEEGKFKGFLSKPVAKPVHSIKPIPKSFAIVKPVPKLIPINKSIPKSFRAGKPSLEPQSFQKSKPFFEKPVPKFPLDPKFKKPLLPPLPVHKPIPTP